MMTQLEKRLRTALHLETDLETLRSYTIYEAVGFPTQQQVMRWSCGVEGRRHYTIGHALPAMAVVRNCSAL